LTKYIDVDLLRKLVEVDGLSLAKASKYFPNCCTETVRRIAKRHGIRSSRWDYSKASYCSTCMEMIPKVKAINNGGQLRCPYCKTTLRQWPKGHHRRTKLKKKVHESTLQGEKEMASLDAIASMPKFDPSPWPSSLGPEVDGEDIHEV